MEAEVSTLPNGLRIATQQLAHVETAAVAISVGVGARHETAAQSGISHLLEHMAFKGTPTRNARQIAEEFDAIGGQFNAYTSMESTVYHAKVIANDIDRACEILGDIFLNSLMDEAELTREREVVLQEIAMHQDSPDDYITDLLDVVAFPDQPMGRSILGPASQVAAYTRQDLLNYQHAHYTAPQIVLSAAGKVDHAQFVSIAERFIPVSRAGTQSAVQPGAYQGGVKVQEKTLEQLHLMLGLPSCSVHDPLFFAYQEYSNILGGGMSSRLFQEVREKRGLAYTVYAGLSAYQDCGMLVIYTASSTDEKRALVELLVDELRRMRDGVKHEELARAKNQLRAELLFAREHAGQVASSLGRHLLRYGRVRTKEELLGQIDAVQADDIIKVANHVMTHALSAAALGPIKGLPDWDKISARLRA